MSNLRNEIRVRYDEKQERIEIYDSSGVEGHHGMLLLQFELNTLKPMGVSGAGQWIGEPILFLLSGTKNAFFGSDAQIEEQLAKDIDDLIQSNEIIAQEDNASPEIQFELAQLYLSRARKMKSVSDINKADEWLRKAASQNHKKSIDFITDSWDLVKSAITHYISVQQTDELPPELRLPRVT